MEQIKITTGYAPGAIGRIAELHSIYYNREWNFGLFFESKVAMELCAFLERYEPARDCMLLAYSENRIEGSIIIDGIHAGTKGAHLRWFILSDTIRSQGIGTRLIDEAIEFCRKKNYHKTYLWTFEGLGAARHLYEQHGFVLKEEQRGEQWGSIVNEQYFELLDTSPVKSES